MNTIHRDIGDVGLQSHSDSPDVLGRWTGESTVHVDAADQAALIRQWQQPLYAVLQEGRVGLVEGGSARLGSDVGNEGLEVLGYVPACRPEILGDATFCSDHRLKYAYMAGAMANGIASVEVVEAMSQRGMLGVFGAAGLPLSQVEAAIDRLQASLGEDGVYGVNLIHSPNEPAMEDELAKLFIARGVRLIEASAYLRITPAVVRYRLHGIHRDTDGRIVTPNRIIGKVSRVELATKFYAPPPEKIVAELVASGDLTQEQAEMSREIPLAQDITAEADSGGHTDNRPAIALMPTLVALRDRMQAEYGYEQTLRLGLAGGISTPASALAAFAMGAAYIVTGSVNQACVESGSSDVVRKMLTEAQQADVAMAPAADMFEMGVNVQVLKRGTMFSMRAAKLYTLYRAHGSLDDIQGPEREKLEKTILLKPVDQVWAETRAFFTERDPKQVERAERDPKHKMALVFRWYLGQSSRWANSGVPERTMDYQVWCGPAMGAFNEWVRGSFLEAQEAREVGVVALNILCGATILARVDALKRYGLLPSPTLQAVTPQPEDALRAQLDPNLVAQ